MERDDRPPDWDAEPPPELQWPDERRFPFRRFRVPWIVLFFIIQYVVLILISRYEPDGFDRCPYSPADREKVIQRIIAGIGVALSAVVAIWRLRSWRLAPALLVTALVGLAWATLLDDSQNC